MMVKKLVLTTVKAAAFNISYSKSGHPFKILETFRKNGRTFACVEFINTGTTDKFRLDAVNNGDIKDRYAKDIMGMFCIGKAKKINNKKQYNLWHHMLERCYDKQNKSFPDYGKKGVTVCSKWHCFEYFLGDIPLIEGYDETLFNNGLLQLDKDIKQKNSLNKIYSLETCKFVSREENMKHRVLKREIK